MKAKGRKERQNQRKNGTKENIHFLESFSIFHLYFRFVIETPDPISSEDKSKITNGKWKMKNEK
jgi:hypothetical protein